MSKRFIDCNEEITAIEKGNGVNCDSRDGCEMILEMMGMGCGSFAMLSRALLLMLVRSSFKASLIAE